MYSSKAIIAILLKHGFQQVSQRGSQVQLRSDNRIVIVPHPKKEIPYGTFQSIVRQSGLDRKDFSDN
ncbi:type II toxin-antitoxin system HicA family toxin [Pelobacter sp. M08fum]|uniref:Type II toxin-antitoxin system HicA family toxin n=2 Tax=Pelovirga terrestris TaxID=2771352 RepID=A0A8J6QZA0_9BACT|nr:type II toxin-antitoxin system HicA family toxin [Pelovirga terrestris]